MAQIVMTDEIVKAALAPLDDVGFEVEAALQSEGIFVWGPDGERFERMFEVVMNIRRAEYARTALAQQGEG